MNVAVLGSTGSIGRQTAEVLAHLGLRPYALTAGKNSALLEEQTRRLKPSLVSVYDEASAKSFRTAVADLPVRVVCGAEGNIEAAAHPSVDTVVISIIGMAALLPTLAALEAGKKVALANKEILVCAGAHVMETAKRCGAVIIPVDSEHSAIFQCLEGAHGNEPSKLILTASGGPFFGMTPDEMHKITPELALAHPTWLMGPKITVDCATLMNKGLELIEAMWLYGMDENKIDIVIHRESIIHSMVEYDDNSVIAQLGVPDMRLPIQYALTYPARTHSLSGRLDLIKTGKLTFYKPDYSSFPCLSLARRAARDGGNAGAVLNGANEYAVDMFLKGGICFTDIAGCVEYALDTTEFIENPSVQDILQSDEQARREVSKMV